MPSNDTTPAEKAFLKQADKVREALLVFNTIGGLKAPGPIFNALTELVNVTVRLYSTSSLIKTDLLFHRSV